MAIDLEHYPREMRRLWRIGTALLIPGVGLVAVGVFWLILVVMVFAFHEEMQAEAGEDYGLILSLMLVMGVVPSIAGAGLVALGRGRRRLYARLRDLVALTRLHGVPAAAAVEERLGLTPRQRAELVRAAARRGLLPEPAGDEGTDAGPGEPGAVFNETYAVEQVLRQDERGAVYRVRHVRTEQPYALETFVAGAERPADEIERTLRASLAASELDHPGLVRVVDVDRTPAGMPFAVTEWLEGEAAPERGGDPAIAEAVDVLRGAGLVLEGDPAERVFVARVVGGDERVVLLHVGYLVAREG